MQKIIAILKKIGIDPSDFTAKGLLTVVGVFFVGLGVLGIASNALSQFTLPLADAFGVERSVISLYSTFSKISGAAAALMFGLVYKKLTVKGTVLMAGLTLVIQYAMIAVASSPAWVYAACTIGGFGTQFAGSLFIMSVIRPWFPRNVGIFAAICGTASGFGGQIFIPHVARRIVDNGYQAGAWMVCILVAIGTVIAAIMCFQSPNDPLRRMSKEEEAKMKAAKEAAAAAKAEKQAASGVPALGYKDFLKTPTMWLLMLATFVAAGTNQPFVTAWNGIADWRGYENAALVGAAAVASYNGLLVWAKFIMGYMKDRNWTVYAVILAWGTNIISVLGVMFFSANSPKLFEFFCTLNAFAGTSTGILIALCNVQAFGKYFNAAAHGLSSFVFNIGRAIGAPLIHLPYDLTGSYNITLWVLLGVGFFMLAVLLLVLKTGEATQKKLDARFGIATVEA